MRDIISGKSEKDNFILKLKNLKAINVQTDTH
jgi:hypothetical protein